MTEPKDLLLVNEQLRRSNRRWKALALAACFALALMVVGGFVAAVWQQARANAQLHAANAAVAQANAARNQGQPR
jgi:cell division protein FtsB